MFAPKKIIELDELSKRIILSIAIPKHYKKILFADKKAVTEKLKITPITFERILSETKSNPSKAVNAFKTIGINIDKSIVKYAIKNPQNVVLEFLPILPKDVIIDYLTNLDNKNVVKAINYHRDSLPTSLINRILKDKQILKINNILSMLSPKIIKSLDSESLSILIANSLEAITNEYVRQNPNFKQCLNEQLLENINLAHLLLKNKKYVHIVAAYIEPSTIIRLSAHPSLNKYLMYIIKKLLTHKKYLFKALFFIGAHKDSVYAVAWSPDGTKIASAGSSDKTVRVWDAATGKLLVTLEDHSWVYAVTWSPDGKYIASGSGDNTVRVWDATTGKLLRTLKGHSDYVSSVAWSPDGTKIASGSSDTTVRVWDAATGKLLRTLKGHSDYVSSVAWSPDGKYIASSSSDNTVRVWDATTGKLLRTLKGHSDYVSSVAWSPDGTKIASGSSDTTVRVWDAATGKLLRTLKGHSGYVNAVAWSPDGKYIASGNGDNTVRVWDTTTDKLLVTLEDHSWVYAVAWSPDGKYIASGNGDNTVRVWRHEYYYLINYLFLGNVKLFTQLLNDLECNMIIMILRNHKIHNYATNLLSDLGVFNRLININRCNIQYILFTWIYYFPREFIELFRKFDEKQRLSIYRNSEFYLKKKIDVLWELVKTEQKLLRLIDDDTLIKLIETYGAEVLEILGDEKKLMVIRKKPEFMLKHASTLEPLLNKLNSNNLIFLISKLPKIVYILKEETLCKVISIRPDLVRHISGDKLSNISKYLSERDVAKIMKYNHEILRYVDNRILANIVNKITPSLAAKYDWLANRVLELVNDKYILEMIRSGYLSESVFNNRKVIDLVRKEINRRNLKILKLIPSGVIEKHTDLFEAVLFHNERFIFEIKDFTKYSIVANVLRRKYGQDWIRFVIRNKDKMIPELTALLLLYEIHNIEAFAALDTIRAKLTSSDIIEVVEYALDIKKDINKKLMFKYTPIALKVFEEEPERHVDLIDELLAKDNLLIEKFLRLGSIVTLRTLCFIMKSLKEGKLSVDYAVNVFKSVSSEYVVPYANELVRVKSVHQFEQILKKIGVSCES